MKKHYDSIGVIFEKQIINEHFILKAISVARCNELDEAFYDVENNNELENMFIGSIDLEDSTVIGYVIKEDELIKKYGSVDDGIISLKELTFPYIFIQDYNLANGITLTYKFDKNTQRFFKIAESTEDGILFNEVEITEKDDEYNLKINLSDAIDTKRKQIEDKKYIENNYDNNNDDYDIDIDVKSLYETIKESIIGQDDTIKDIISTLDRNFNIDNYRNKTNILLIGPNGSGKSEMLRTISETINVPITIEDSEQYSAVGYMGNSVDDMLVKLYEKANGNLEAAEHGIIVIDEIDKKVTNQKGDVSGDRVLNAILTMMEGSIVRINTGSEFNPNYIMFDTSKVTFVLCGAFSDLVVKLKGIGFNAELEKQKKYKEIIKEDLKKYGLSNDLMRRISIYRLNELTVDDLINIMKYSKNSALLEYYRYAKKKDIKLNIDDDAIRKIAEIAIKEGTGASSIKSILNNLLNKAFFEVCYNEGIYSSIKITEDSIDKNPPYILYKKRNTKH